IQVQMIELLRALQARHRLAYLFISHDLRVIRALSDEVIVMRAGTVVERGPTAQIFERPHQPYTRALIAAALDLEVVEHDAVASCNGRLGGGPGMRSTKLLLLAAPTLVSLFLLQSYFWVPTFENQARGDPGRLTRYISSSIADAVILNPAISADSASSEVNGQVFE